MFIYKTDAKPKEANHVMKLIQEATHDTGIYLPHINDVLLLDVSLDYLYHLKTKIEEAIAIKKCGNY